MRAWKAAWSRPLLVAAFTTVVAAGCGGGGGGDGPTAPPIPSGPPTTLSQIQSQVFTPSCARVGCHTGSGQAGLILSTGAARGNLVNVPSSQQPALSRVVPGNAEASYLVRKIRGDASITGARMPISAAPLTQSQIDGIIQWINDGAPAN